MRSGKLTAVMLVAAVMMLVSVSCLTSCMNDDCNIGMPSVYSCGDEDDHYETSRGDSSDFYDGNVSSGEVYLLCSDGFRHVIAEDEMYAQLNPGFHHSPESLNKSAVYLTELNKYRRETDNISVVLIKSE